MKKIIILIIFIILALIVFSLVFDWGRREAIAPSLENNATTTSELPIIVSYPIEGQEVKSPIKITGKARGTWFFEASFPIQLVDDAGNIISTAIATADGDWMTTDYVDFTAEISYTASSTGPALLVLNNDNPSGDPGRSLSKFIPVLLK